MKKVPILYNQSLTDLAVQEYGSEWQRGLLEILEHNDVSLASTPAAGTEIVIKNVNEQDSSLQYFKAHKYQVATGAFLIAPPLAADLLLAIAISQTRIDLSWRDNADNEEYYELEYSLDGENWNYLDQVAANEEAYSAVNLQPETKYYFRNFAYRDGSASAYSNVASATTLAGAVKFVAVSNNSRNIMTSSNGLLWREREELLTGGCYDVCWGEYGTGRWVAAKPNQMEYSDDGLTWTAVNVSGNWKKVIYANGIYLAVSYYLAGVTGVIATSVDGENWIVLTRHDIDSGTLFYHTLNAVAFGDNMFIALCYTFSPRTAVVKVGNGDWLRYTTPGGQWTDIVFGNDIFVAIGENTGSQATQCATTLDGENWVTRALPNDYDYISIAFGLGLFVAVSGNDGASVGGVITSPDGITWTVRAVPDKNYTDIVFQGGRFIAVSKDETMQVLTSIDGITWELLNYSYTPDWKAIAAAEDLFAPVLAGEEISSTEIELTWTHNNAVVTGFELQECTDGVSWVEIATPGSEDDTEQVDELAGGTEYKFRIRAVNGTDKSKWSNVVIQETSFANPLQLYGNDLLFWFEAEDVNINPSNNRVEQMNDKSNHGRHIYNVTASKQPARTIGIDGQTYVNFLDDRKGLFNIAADMGGAIAFPYYLFFIHQWAPDVNPGNTIKHHLTDNSAGVNTSDAELFFYDGTSGGNAGCAVSQNDGYYLNPHSDGTTETYLWSGKIANVRNQSFVYKNGGGKWTGAGAANTDQLLTSLAIGNPSWYNNPQSGLRHYTMFAVSDMDVKKFNTMHEYLAARFPSLNIVNPNLS